MLQWQFIIHPTNRTTPEPNQRDIHPPGNDDNKESLAELINYVRIDIIPNKTYVMDQKIMCQVSDSTKMRKTHPKKTRMVAR